MPFFSSAVFYLLVDSLKLRVYRLVSSSWEGFLRFALLLDAWALESASYWLVWGEPLLVFGDLSTAFAVFDCFFIGSGFFFWFFELFYPGGSDFICLFVSFRSWFVFIGYVPMDCCWFNISFSLAFRDDANGPTGLEGFCTSMDLTTELLMLWVWSVLDVAFAWLGVVYPCWFWLDYSIDCEQNDSISK